LLEHLSAAGFTRPGLRSRAVEALGRRNGGTDGVALAVERGLDRHQQSAPPKPRGKAAATNRASTEAKAAPVSESSHDDKAAAGVSATTKRFRQLSQQRNAAKDGSKGSQGRRGSRGGDVHPPLTPTIATIATIATTSAKEEMFWEDGCDDDDAGSLHAAAEESHHKEQEARERLISRAPLLKALLCAALFPQVITVEGGKGGKSGGKGGGKGGEVKFRAREEGSQEGVEVVLHPSCVASKEPGSKLESIYLVYHERVETSRVFIRDATPVPPYSLILFGGALTAERKAPKAQQGGGDEVVLSLDGWIRFKCPKRIQSLVMDLRKELDKILKKKIEDPDLEFSQAAKGVLTAVAALMEEGYQ